MTALMGVGPRRIDRVFEQVLSASHVVYGLRLAANAALSGVPPQRGSETPDVRIRLKDGWAFPATVPASCKNFYSSSDEDPSSPPNLLAGPFPGRKHFGFFYRDGARFAVDRRGCEVWADWPEKYTLEDACTYLLGPVMGFVLRLRGITCLHASAVAIGDRALALAGFPGAGKSTAAAAFAQRGFPVIADDVVALTEDSDSFLVQPGYPRVNLWPDSVRALFGSEEALPRITPTWDKRYMALGDDGPSFAPKPLPLGAIYILGEREAALKGPIVEEIAGSNAFVALVANTYVNYLLDREMRRREFEVLSRLVSEIPIRRVRPPAGPSTIFDLCEAITANAKQAMPASVTSGFSL